MILLPLPAFAGAVALPDRLAARTTQVDVVLVPPVGAPSPPAGSFLIPDPTAEGAFQVGPSACSSALTFDRVPADEVREELWLVDVGVGARLGLPQLGLTVGAAKKSVAGLAYRVTEKLVVAGGLDALEQCCLRSPETCTDRYVSEYWVGTGEIHRLSATTTALKASVRTLDKLGSIDFGSAKGWSVASTWAEPMYFAYRTSAFLPRTCESYMNELPDQPGKILFTGVSRRVGSEQEARRDAQGDARLQVARYLGEHVVAHGADVATTTEAVVSGVKDTLTCMDPVTDTPEGPAHLARVRMYVDTQTLRGGNP